MDRFFGSSDEACALVRQESESVILAFSCGKDSVAAWLQLRRHFAHIIPFYLYLIPDLDFVEKSLRYYEGFFKTRIIRLPHPSLYRMLNMGVFESPRQLEIVRRSGLPIFSYGDVRQVLCEDNNLPLSTFYATGIRGANSIARRIVLVKNGCLFRDRNVFYPIWDWRIDRLIDEIRAAGVALPIDYEWFGRSFDGLDSRFASVIRRQAPADYEKIKAYFPLVGVEEERHKYEQKIQD